MPTNAPETANASALGADVKSAAKAQTPPPSPTELLAFAAALRGPGAFPTGFEEQDNLLRDALVLWQRAHKFIGDVKRFGYDAVTTKDRYARFLMEAGIISEEQRANFEKWAYTFNEMICAVTGETTSVRALPKFRKWLLANRPVEGCHPAPPEEQITEANLAETLQTLRTRTFSAIQVSAYADSFREWWPMHISETNSAAAAKARLKRGTAKKRLMP